MPDDVLPEERDAQHKELIALLRQTPHTSVAATEKERAETLARVRERLLRIEEGGKLNEDGPGEQVGVLAAPLPEQLLFIPSPRRERRVLHFINSLAAVLVVGALIGTALLLFTHRSPASGTPVTVRAEAGGLEASMRLTPGPYFLGELLAIDLSLTNHSHTTFLVSGSSSAVDAGKFCEAALTVTITGGHGPHYTLPLREPGCLFPLVLTTLKPGQAISMRQYWSLTSSGQVTLEESAHLAATPSNKGGSPLDGHWPSIRINVDSKVPADRMLSFTVLDARVHINAPQAALPHLLYRYQMECRSSQNGGTIMYGTPGWDPLSWKPLPTNDVQKPDCSGTIIHWMFDFSAPGYAIVSGSYPPS
jgi:hypothetical protein